jgi:hypothetical protein
MIGLQLRGAADISETRSNAVAWRSLAGASVMDTNKLHGLAEVVLLPIRKDFAYGI